MDLFVTTPFGEHFSGQVDYVKLPGELGPFQVLPGHASMISTLVNGQMVYADKGRVFSLDIEDGLASVCNNKIQVICSPK